MLETILARIGLPMLITFVSESLKQIESPVAKGAAKALEDVDKALKEGQISLQELQEANRHIEQIEKFQSDEFKANLAAVNETIRAEVVSDDVYVRRMRPTFGYLMAVTWAAQMLGIAYVIVFDTIRAAYIMNGMASLSAIWAVGLSVLGIYVYKRSEDKKLFMPPEIIQWKG